MPAIKGEMERHMLTIKSQNSVLFFIFLFAERYASPDSEPAAGEEYGAGDGSTIIISFSP